MSISKINISVILTVFNEEQHILQCLESLLKQTIEGIEIIIIDDASTDHTYYLATNFVQVQSKKTLKKISLHRLSHRGPGECRNFGADKAQGGILIFLDGDMFFELDFLQKLVDPILKNSKVIGTESQSEFLANPENFWAKCWNIGRFASAGNFTLEYKKTMVPNKQNFGGVFRAIRKKEFVKVNGFDTGGDYSDDETLGIKLGIKSTLANDAVFFHFNPDNLHDVWRRALWIGKDRKFGRADQKYANLLKFSLPASIVKGFLIGLKTRYLPFVIFKIVFDGAIWLSIFGSI